MLGHRVARVVLGAVLVLATCVALTAQTPSETSGKWEAQRLRSTLEQRYRVAPLQDGVALIPRRDAGDIKSIEVTGSTVAINGNVVTGAELRERLKGDSEAILALSYLDPAARRELFEPKTAPPSREAEPQPRPDTSPGQTPPPEQPAQTTEPEIRTHAESRVHIGGGVDVREHEAVDGPVVAIGGPVTVDGEVGGDVVAVGGNVRLGRYARVRGDVTSVGGSIDRDPQSEVSGKLNEIRFAFPHVRLRRGFGVPAAGFLGGVFGPGVEMAATVFRMLLFGLLAVLALLIARTPIERIERTVAVDAWKAGLVGLLSELLFIPIFFLTIIVLAVSIIGIPLLLFIPPLAIVVFVLALIVGFAGVAYRVGRWTAQRFGWSQQSAVGLVCVGLLAIWALALAGRAVSIVGWPLWFVSSALLVAGFLVEYVAWTVGLGAAVITRLGTRGGVPVVPPPPPPPAGPVAGGVV